MAVIVMVQELDMSLRMLLLTEGMGLNLLIPKQFFAPQAPALTP